MSRLEMEEVPAGYKRTEVGVIPEDWDVEDLGKIYDFQNGVNAEKSAYGRGTPFVNVLEIITMSIIGLEDIPGLVDLPKPVATAYALQDGDVVFNRTSETQEEVGLASIYVGDSEVIFGGFVIRGRPSRHRYYTKFAPLMLRSRAVRDQIISAGQGVVRANIGQEALRRIKVVVPPFDEQRVIARTLSDADTLIKALEHLISKKRLVKQGAMQELLTGKRRLPGFKKDWKLKAISDFANTTSGGTPTTTDSRFWGGHIPWMSSGELNLRIVHEVQGRITEEGLKNSSTKIIPQNCVLMGLAGQGKTRGTVAINKIPLCTNQSIAAILPGLEHSSEYLYYNLDFRYDELRELSSGDGGRGGINLRIINSLVVPFPSLKEQSAIAQVLSDMDAELIALETKLKKARSLKQGMMQQLLTGKIRLVAPTRDPRGLPKP